LHFFKALADLAIAWVNNTNPFVMDYIGAAYNGLPTKDTIQNINATSASTVSGIFSVQFSRQYPTTGDNQDGDWSGIRTLLWAINNDANVLGKYEISFIV